MSALALGGTTISPFNGIKPIMSRSTTWTGFGRVEKYPHAPAITMMTSKRIGQNQLRRGASARRYVVSVAIEFHLLRQKDDGGRGTCSDQVSESAQPDLTLFRRESIRLGVPSRPGIHLHAGELGILFGMAFELEIPPEVEAAWIERGGP